MDYLLRDSLHTGVDAGTIDYHQLISEIRILPKTQTDSCSPALGLTAGAISSAYAFLTARNNMYEQVYTHPANQSYEMHLQNFLEKSLAGGMFAPDLQAHLKLRDHRIQSSLETIAEKPNHPGYREAKRVLERGHFRELCSEMGDRAPLAQKVFNAARLEFGENAVRVKSYRQKGRPSSFPVLTKDGRIESSLDKSTALRSIPPFQRTTVFIEPNLKETARDWLKEKYSEIEATTFAEKDSHHTLPTYGRDLVISCA